MVKKIETLTKEELDILFYFVKNKSMSVAHRTSINFFLPEYNGTVYDSKDIHNILNNLVNAGFLKTTTGKIVKTTNLLGQESAIVDLEYGIPDKSTYQELYKIFIWRLRRDRFLNFIVETWNYLWKHFIITIIVSLITAYFSYRLFGQFQQ